MVFPTRSQFYAGVFKQFFVFPDSIIYYISKHPISPKFYQKMIQICKYFFIQNSIIVLSKIWCNDIGFEIYVNNQYKPFEIKNASLRKLWITDKLDISHSCDISSLLPKIYRFDVTELILFFQNISFDELLLFSSNVETLDICKVTIKYNDGSIVPLEKIVEVFPKLLSLTHHDFSPSKMSAITFKELLKIPQFLMLYDCNLWFLHENFDIESWYTYIKKNKHTKFRLDFSDPLSEAYENRLEKIIDEIIENNYKRPYIYYSGLNQEKRIKMDKFFFTKYD